MTGWSSCDLCFPFFGSDVVGHLRWIMIDVRYCNFNMISRMSFFESQTDHSFQPLLTGENNRDALRCPGLHARYTDALPRPSTGKMAQPPWKLSCFPVHAVTSLWATILSKHRQEANARASFAVTTFLSKHRLKKECISEEISIRLGFLFCWFSNSKRFCFWTRVQTKRVITFGVISLWRYMFGEAGGKLESPYLCRLSPNKTSGGREVANHWSMDCSDPLLPTFADRRRTQWVASLWLPATSVTGPSTVLKKKRGSSCMRSICARCWNMTPC